MKKITHLFIYKTEKDGVFDNVNSYNELNETIKKYGKEQSKLQETEELKKGVYNDTTGDLFEIYTQFFGNRYGETPLLNIKNVIDTSDEPFTAGYDFTFTSLFDKPGQIQSKWRSNPIKQFKLKDLATNDSIAAACDIEKNDNILFTNLDDTENLFHFSYTYARKKRRVIGRNAQEEFILRDPKFWNDFSNPNLIPPSPANKSINLIFFISIAFLSYIQLVVRLLLTIGFHNFEFQFSHNQ
jgi:hypothetical protein